MKVEDHFQQKTPLSTVLRVGTGSRDTKSVVEIRTVNQETFLPARLRQPIQENANQTQGENVTRGHRNDD